MSKNHEKRQKFRKTIKNFKKTGKIDKNIEKPSKISIKPEKNHQKYRKK